mgnify:CR=1 FL=1
MKLAIIGSRTLWISNLQEYIPDNVTEIVSGGAKGVDRQATAFAKEHHIPLTEFLPISARFIANKASYTFKKQALTTLLEKLQEVIG